MMYYIFLKVYLRKKRIGSFCFECTSLCTLDSKRCEACNTTLCNNHQNKCSYCTGAVLQTAHYDYNVPVFKCCGSPFPLRNNSSNFLNQIKDAETSCLFCLGNVHIHISNNALISCKGCEPMYKDLYPGSSKYIGEFYICKNCLERIPTQS